MKDFELLEKTVKLFNEDNLTELEYRNGDISIKLSRKQNLPAFSVPEPAVPERLFRKQVAAPPAETPILDKKIFYEVKSPIHGNFYRAASPESTPFVSEGDPVKQGQVLCIIESMKLMNEIKSPVSGRIVSIKGENGRPVFKEDVIFLIDEGV